MISIDAVGGAAPAQAGNHAATLTVKMWPAAVKEAEGQVMVVVETQGVEAQKAAVGETGPLQHSALDGPDSPWLQALFRIWTRMHCLLRMWSI